MTPTSLEGPKLFFESKLTEPLFYAVCDGTVSIFTTPDPEKTTVNEDAAGIIPLEDKHAILAVADGVGGSKAGNLASRIVIESLAAESTNFYKHPRTFQSYALGAIQTANEKILTQSKGSATTLAMVTIENNYVRPYHAGDSQIFIIGQKGTWKLQTLAHAPVAYGVESGLLTQEEAIKHEDRNLVTNVVGAVDMRIEMGSPIELAQRDTLILATDGLLDNLHPDEVGEIVRKGPIDEATNTLIAIVQQRMAGKTTDHYKPDDLTVILYRRN